MLRHYYAPMLVNYLFAKNSYVLILLVAVSLLGACGRLPEIPVTDESYQAWARRQQALGKIDAWEIQARTAIFVKQEVTQVGISWVRERERFVVMIQAPLGQGVFRVESNTTADQSAAIKLSMPDGQLYYGHSAESLLSQLFGWSIPFSGLTSWIKGLPQQPEPYTYELYADGRLKSLRQAGWLINYLDYFTDDGAEQGLPKKMYLKHRDLALKIVIDRWHPLELQEDTPVVFPDFN
ncbi:MAG: lipoprotein insertase outer membrane protein LolB [Gammaproteobacteria bacterium]